MINNSKVRSLVTFIFLTAGLFFLACGSVLAQKQMNEELKGGCMTQEEMILFNLVNDLRKQNKLEIIPLSWSLSKVSDMHIHDLQSWNPQEKGCSLHSWSETGPWKPCCNTKDPSGTRCMNDKPSELTGYSGKGYELIYWDDETATPFDAFELWKQVEASREMILNKGKWESKSWKAMGVGIENGYAVIWLGDKTDKFFNISICGADTLVQSAKPALSEPAINTRNAMEPASGKQPSVKEPYFIIVASFAAESQATDRKAELVSQGYQDATIIQSNGRFRVSLGSYATEAKAKARMKDLRASFPDCWLYKQ